MSSLPIEIPVLWGEIEIKTGEEFIGLREVGIYHHGWPIRRFLEPGEKIEGKNVFVISVNPQDLKIKDIQARVITKNDDEAFSLHTNFHILREIVVGYGNINDGVGIADPAMGTNHGGGMTAQEQELVKKINGLKRGDAVIVS